MHGGGGGGCGGGVVVVVVVWCGGGGGTVLLPLGLVLLLIHSSAQVVSIQWDRALAAPTNKCRCLPGTLIFLSASLQLSLSCWGCHWFGGHASSPFL